MYRFKQNRHKTKESSRILINIDKASKASRLCSTFLTDVFVCICVFDDEDDQVTGFYY